MILTLRKHAMNGTKGAYQWVVGGGGSKLVLMFNVAHLHILTTQFMSYFAS